MSGHETFLTDLRDHVWSDFQLDRKPGTHLQHGPRAFRRRIIVRLTICLPNRSTAVRTGVRRPAEEVLMAAVWVSYAELAEHLGISPEAARQKSIRARWERQLGDDGKARVLVDLEEAAAAHRPRPIERPDEQVTTAAVIAALEQHVATLKEELAKAQTLAAERDLDAYRERERIADLTTQLLTFAGEAMAARALRRQARADPGHWWQRLGGRLLATWKRNNQMS